MAESGLARERPSAVQAGAIYGDERGGFKKIMRQNF